MPQYPHAIAHIVADGRPGGGSTMVLGLIDELQNVGQFVCTLVSQPDSYLANEAARRGLPFISFNFFTGLADPSVPWRLAQQLGLRRFVLTHLHGQRAAHHGVRWPLRQKLGALVYTGHGLHQLQQGPALRSLANLAERQIMRRTQANVFVSKADQQSARDWRLLSKRDDGQVIPNGIDLRAIQPRLVQNDMARNFDVSFVARMVEQKAPDVAARVLAELAAAGYRCLFAGGGPLRQLCMELLQALPGGCEVVCRDEVQHEEALSLLARSRVVIMPSRWEGLPLLPMEAMALGTPVVASRLSGVAEVIEDDSTGRLTAPGDVAAMVAAAKQLLSDTALRQRMQEAGAARVRELFSQSAMAARYTALYSRLLGSG